MQFKTIGLRAKALLLVSVLLLAVNVALGLILISQSKTAMKILIQERMLDVANTAAAMMDGDAYEKIRADGKDTAEYQAVFRTLDSFLKNTTLKYIYGIREEPDGRFIFTIDPAPENTSAFGETVMMTDALRKAAKGTPAVCEEPYTDEYGTFYTAYSPIYNSSGKMVGLVAADCDAQWYEDQIAKSENTIILGCLLSLLIGAGVVLPVTRWLFQKFKELQSQISALSVDVHTFTDEILGASASAGTMACAASENLPDKESSSDNILHELNAQIQVMRSDLKSHIDNVRALAYRDPLTGVKSKHAYVESEDELNRLIQSGSLREFAVASFDINGLKQVNDTQGHTAGDELIRSGCALICEHFAHSPVFRAGGDEFEVILQGRDFENRHAILQAFNEQTERNLCAGKVVVAVGMSEYVPSEDNSLQDVFLRADAEMYERKRELKRMGQ